jgi:hypothetical protein
MMMVKIEAGYLATDFNESPDELFSKKLFIISFWNFISLNTGCSACFILSFTVGLDELNS